MRYLFYVHSHITFLVAKQFVMDRQISPNDCLFLCVRNYKLPEEYVSVFPHTADYPDGVLKNSYRLWQGIHYTRSLNNIHEFESYINDVFQNKPFLFFLPNTFASDFSSAVVTMPLCKGFYILEEGSASYAEENTLPKLFYGWRWIFYKYILKPLFPRFYVMRGSFYSSDHKKYKGTVATSLDAFKSLKGEKCVVSNPFGQELLAEVPDVVLSVDACWLSFFSIDDARYVFSKLNDLFQMQKKEKIVYKFHPNFYKDKDAIKLYRSLLQECFPSPIELPVSAVLENILNTYHSDFYSDVSSVGLYASVLGVNCYSYAKWLAARSETYACYFEKFPKVALNSYKLL